MEVAITLVGVIFSLLSLVTIRWVITRHRKHQFFNRYGIPGPKPNFFAGHMYHLRSEPTPSTVVSRWLKQYGNICGIFFGEVPYIVIKDLEILKQVLIKDFNLFSNRPDIYLDSGVFPKTLVGLKDRRWKEVRSIVTPMFSSGKIKQMANIVSRKVDLTVDLITQKATSDEMFDIYSMMQGLTLDVIAACALAMKTKCQENNKDKLLLSVRDFLRYQHHKGIEYSVMFPFLARIFTALGNYTAFGDALNYILNHLSSVIKYRRENPDIKSVDILQALLDKSEFSNTDENKTDTKLTEEEVIANAFVVFLAGYETTATALAFTFYLLTTHPDVQNRLYDEIQKAEDDSYATIQGLQYLEAVFNEALRLYPPVTGFTTRHCIRDYQVGSLTIPKGACIMAPVWDIHHDPELWPDPWKFDPERFSPSNKGSIKSMSYMPFGDGPRNCVGARFAQLEAKTILFKLLKKLKLETCERTEDPLSLICHTVITLPGNGVWVRAVPRTESI